MTSDFAFFDGHGHGSIETNLLYHVAICSNDAIDAIDAIRKQVSRSLRMEDTQSLSSRIKATQWIQLSL